MTDHCYDPDGNPITLYEWAELFEQRATTRDVAESWWRKRTVIAEAGCEVSTVWLGLDHRFGFTGPGKPLIWEAMIFGGDHDGDQYRYATRGEAYDHHEQLVREIRAEHEARVENGG